jgi:3',5'-cyclic AMP phosphodiesterase CpdA
VATPRAQIGLAAGTGEKTIGAPATVPAALRTVRLDDGRTVTHYKAEFTGLKAATSYAYRVGDGTSFGAWRRFTTASAEAAPFRFIYLGDAQNGLIDKWPPVVRAAFAAAPDARFVVHAGDLLAEGYDDSLWGAWLAGMGARAADVPNIPIPGNHDLHRSPSVDASGSVFAASALWSAHFALPANGPPELNDLAGQNYYLDYQGVRFVGIDVNAFANDDFVPSERVRVRDAQTHWLRRVIGTNPCRWTIVVQHQPIYPVVKGRDFAKMRAVLGSIYDEYQVDLVLQGHDHVYARTHKVYGGRLAEPHAPGTIYVISVSGSKMYGITNSREPLMAAMREDTPLYQLVSVTDGRLSYESRDATGALADAFDLVKAAGPTSTYVDRGPGRTTAGRARSAQPSESGRPR